MLQRMGSLPWPHTERYSMYMYNDMKFLMYGNCMHGVSLGKTSSFSHAVKSVRTRWSILLR